jgi:hypothetical protein
VAGGYIVNSVANHVNPLMRESLAFENMRDQISLLRVLAVQLRRTDVIKELGEIEASEISRASTSAFDVTTHRR